MTNTVNSFYPSWSQSMASEEDLSKVTWTIVDGLQNVTDQLDDSIWNLESKFTDELTKASSNYKSLNNRLRNNKRDTIQRIDQLKKIITDVVLHNSIERLNNQNEISLLQRNIRVRKIAITVLIILFSWSVILNFI